MGRGGWGKKLLESAPLWWGIPYADDVGVVSQSPKQLRKMIGVIVVVQMTSSRVRLGQSFKTVGYGSASCWGDVGAGSVEAET